MFAKTFASLVIISSFLRCESSIACGLNNKDGTRYKKQPRELIVDPFFVINGRNAAPGEVPWVTELIMRFSRSGAMCGGAILDNTTVLTAAHCVYECRSSQPLPENVAKRYCPNNRAQNVRVCIGERNRADSSDGQRCFNTQTFHVHEKYLCCSTNYWNDIAIIKVKEGMDVPQFSKNGLGSTNTICLPNATDDYETPKKAVIAGWGRNSATSGSIPNILQTATVNIISNDDCKETYGDIIDDTQLCALGPNKESACSGDSGSAIYVYDKGQATAVGISSFAADERCVDNPLVYTRVSKFRDFIDKYSEKRKV